jgi:hypothetical protein
MRKRIVLVVVVVAFYLVGIAGGAGQRVKATGDDELFPCDPTPSQVRICQIHGGTFNYATCRCEFPQ